MRGEPFILHLFPFPPEPVTSFRQIPTFGDTIRRFSNNVSEMKKLAAQNYEDILQVGVEQMLYNCATLTSASART
jgi:hypothetical protein